MIFIFRVLFELSFLLLYILLPEFALKSFLIGVAIQVLGMYFFVVRAIYYLRIKKSNIEITSSENSDEIISIEKANGI